MGDADGSLTSTVLIGGVPGCAWRGDGVGQGRGPRGDRPGFEPRPASPSSDFSQSRGVLCWNMGLAEQPYPPCDVWEGGQVVGGTLSQRLGCGV